MSVLLISFFSRCHDNFFKKENKRHGHVCRTPKETFVIVTWFPTEIYLSSSNMICTFHPPLVALFTLIFTKAFRDKWHWSWPVPIPFCNQENWESKWTRSVRKMQSIADCKITLQLKRGNGKPCVACSKSMGCAIHWPKGAREWKGSGRLKAMGCPVAKPQIGTTAALPRWWWEN